MNILVLNAGSSTLKFKVIDMSTEDTLLSGLCERIGLDGGVSYSTKDGKSKKEKVLLENHDDALKCVVKILESAENQGDRLLDSISGIGHRVAHGGEKFSAPIIVDKDVIQEIEACIELAPLHNVGSVKVIKACKNIFRGIPMVVVFDTAFHQTMPQKAYMYGIPYDVYEKYKVRRYGFHGTSHKYALLKATEHKELSVDEGKVIVCHLGNGSSITAIYDGKSVDTSMGFTPLEGLMMGTRSGDIDPSIIGYLKSKMQVSSKEVLRMLNSESGLKGVSQVSGDLRDLLDAAQQGDKKAKLAIDMFIYRVIKYIGSYIAVMNGVDMIVFTGGIGENSPYVRQAVCESFAYVGVEVDESIASSNATCREISTSNSKVKVMVVAANEELMIARETYEILN